MRKTRGKRREEDDCSGAVARLDELQVQHRALLEARGRHLVGEAATVEGTPRKKKTVEWPDRNERMMRGRKKTDEADTEGAGNNKEGDAEGGADEGGGKTQEGNGGSTEEDGSKDVEEDRREGEEGMEGGAGSSKDEHGEPKGE